VTRGALFALATVVLASCSPPNRGPRWISIEDPWGASFDYVEYGGRRIFSIGCSEGNARVSVAALNPSADTSEVVVHLAGADTTLTRVDREVPGVAAEGALSEAWIEAVARAETVSVEYAGQTYGPLELPSGIRALYAERCREVLTNPQQSP